MKLWEGRKHVRSHGPTLYITQSLVEQQTDSVHTGLSILGIAIAKLVRPCKTKAGAEQLPEEVLAIPMFIIDESFAKTWPRDK